jgi:hypothetical protein
MSKQDCDSEYLSQKCVCLETGDSGEGDCFVSSKSKIILLYTSSHVMNLSYRTSQLLLGLFYWGYAAGT